MHKRTLGKSGFQVSEVGLGCWQLGGDFGPLEDDRARQILATADEVGIHFWDTADVYGMGLSERRIGQYLSARRGRVLVASKVGRHPDLYPDNYTRRSVRASIEGSVRRLGVETLDLIQLHCVPLPVLRDGDILAWLEDFQQQGLIRAFGASVETLEEALLAASHPGVTSLQIIFNIFRQNAVTELFPVAVANRVGIIVRLPLASGVLAGKMSPDEVFDPTDHRHYNRHGKAFSVGETFSGLPFDQAVGWVERMKAWLPEGMTMAQMAMRWVLDHPAVSTVIAGVSRPQQAFENAGAGKLKPLPDNLHDRLADLYREEIEAQIQVPL